MTTRKEPMRISSFILSSSLILSSALSPATVAAAEFEGRITLPVNVTPLSGIKPVTLDTRLSLPQTPGAGFAIPTMPATLETGALIQPGAVIPSITPEAALAQPEITAQTPAQTPATPAQTLGQINERVSNNLDAAGPIKDASASDAAGLGGKLQSALDGESDVTPPAPPVGPNGGDGNGQTPEQNAKLRTLKQVVSIFTEHYAPIEWKQSHRGVHFVAQYDKARAEILAKPGMKDHEFQQILADFVASAQDYHASIIFFSTERAGLPLMILGAGGKYYIAYVDRGELSETKFPYQPGDEVVEFNGQPVGQLSAEFTKFPNTAETDARLNELHLTHRSRASGMDVPQGKVDIKIKSADGKVHTETLTWDYQPEQIPTDVPHRGVVLGPESANPLDDTGSDIASAAKKMSAGDAVRTLLKKFLPSMAHPMTKAFSDQAAANPDNGFMIAGKKTYVPDLGKVIWELPAQVADKIPFVVKIFEDAQGRHIGYIRIPDYMGGGNTDAATQIFEKIIEKFQQDTDGLVIDEVNNPGGDMLYMNDLISMLTDKPMKVPQHRLMIDESDAALAAQILEQAADPGLKEEMENALEDFMAGFQKDPTAMVQPLVDYANFILSELKAGRRLTNPTNIFGIKGIEPHATTRYTKPIVVLTNELDFSAADFFAAIMKLNNRATLFGVRTSGAGGAVKDIQFPNQYGIETLAYTWTIAMNPTIENNGVTPHVAYQITADDLRNAFAGYGKALGDLWDKLLPPGTKTVADPPEDAPAPAPAPKKPTRRPRPKSN